MSIKEVSYNLKTNAGYDKYYFETSTNVVVDLEQGKSLKQILTEINGRSTANEIRITNNFNQNEYQLPIVVGTQLRLTKSNTSKRFFIQLANTLTGTITVSTDSGATSKPLRDVSGVAVTSLEKGFAEIVEDPTFFTLRNRGISAAALQALITAANEVEANSNVVRQSLINTINSTEPSINLPSNSTFTQAINTIPNIVSGKKRKASGSLTVTGPNSSYKFYSNSTTSGFYSIVVPFSEIGFIPSYILINLNDTVLNTNSTEYFKSIGNLEDYARISILPGGSISNVLSYGIGVNENSNGEAYVNENGFRLPVDQRNVVYQWTAYE